MPGLCFERIELAGTVIINVAGKFDGASAWDLCGRLSCERAPVLIADFSQVTDFADYGIAVLSQNLKTAPGRELHLRGLRQHQLRLLGYFGIDAAKLARPLVAAAATGPRTGPATGAMMAAALAPEAAWTQDTVQRDC